MYINVQYKASKNIPKKIKMTWQNWIASIYLCFHKVYGPSPFIWGRGIAIPYQYIYTYSMSIHLDFRLVETATQKASTK